MRPAELENLVHPIRAIVDARKATLEKVAENGAMYMRILAPIFGTPKVTTNRFSPANVFRLDFAPLPVMIQFNQDNTMRLRFISQATGKWDWMQIQSPADATKVMYTIRAQQSKE